MKCPYCLHEDTKVIDKRDFEGMARRRRECLKCEKRFNTHERVERAELKVIKKDERREDFDVEKLKRGILTACEKRPISTEKIDKMLINIENKIRMKGKEVKADFIGEIVSKELRKIDNVAYIRFASVYKDFTDLSDFKKEIKGLLK
ncbi:transcriptional regulator NrdR [Candidatus Pacearchaeota archaeon]|nr:transcriptional regulator NrdR [Candidatus Pacearchaeota archaeon]|tara:strand:- start:15449 stop:15889 length:441 start_codon:yes stop_codon:yes gene_type:complete